MATRLGHAQREAIRQLGTYGPAASVYQLARLIGPHAPSQYGHLTIKRLMQRGLVRRDPNHPDSSPVGAGAIVLTDEGQRVYDQEVSRG